MQLYLCHTSLPWVTSGVMFSALVRSGNWRWLSRVSPRNTTAAAMVAPQAKILAWRLFMMAAPSDVDTGPVQAGHGECEQGGNQYQGQYSEAQDAHGFVQVFELHTVLLGVMCRFFRILIYRIYANRFSAGIGRSRDIDGCTRWSVAVELKHQRPAELGFHRALNHLQRPSEND